MNTKILFTLLAAVSLVACDKETYNTKPTLKLRSINNTVVPFNGNLSLEFEVTDKEGDITDSLFVKKVRLNRRAVPTIRDSFFLTVPQVDKIQKAFVRVDLSYQNYLISAIQPPITGTPPKRENDTLLFKFVLIDKANNASDTFTTAPIVITRQ